MLNLDDPTRESVDWIRAFHAFARREFALEIIDFDLLNGLIPTTQIDAIEAPKFLLDTGRRLIAASAGNRGVADKLSGHLAVLEALLGRVTPLHDYVTQTQNFTIQRFSMSQIDGLRQRAEAAARACHSNLQSMVFEKSPFGEAIIADTDEVKALFNERFEAFRSEIEVLTGQTNTFEIEVSFVEIDEYWRFWVDGQGDRFRLRFNRFRDGFSISQIDQFVLHELIAHCGQASGWRNEIMAGRLNPIHGLTAIHTWEQGHLEGLAQAIPLFLDQGISKELRARVLKDALRQALLHNAYIDTEAGMPPDQALANCDEVLPVEKRMRFYKTLADQKRHPQLRAYMFSYSTGLLALLEALGRDDFDRTEFLRKSFRRPLKLDQFLI